MRGHQQGGDNNLRTNHGAASTQDSVLTASTSGEEGGVSACATQSHTGGTLAGGHEDEDEWTGATHAGSAPSETASPRAHHSNMPGNGKDTSKAEPTSNGGSNSINGNAAHAQVSMADGKQNGASEAGNGSSEGDSGSSAATAALPWCKDTYVRIMVQAMRDMGYNASADKLEEEAGVRLKSDLVTDLEKAVLQGEWKRVELQLVGLHSSQQDTLSLSSLNKSRYMVKRQEFLELLEQNQVAEAMQCLQTQMTPLAGDGSEASKVARLEEVQKLARLLVCGDRQELYHRANWLGSKHTRAALLKEVLACLPSSTVVPSGRLQTLVAQSLEHQMKSCTRYNRRQQWNNLLEDCTAGDELVPRRTHLLLEHHTDEVWHIQFSGCGKMLASGSKDKTVIIWSLHDKPLVKHHLKQHTDAVSYVAWSPDDKWLVSGGNDLVVKVWDTSSGALLRDFVRHREPVTAIAWLDRTGRFVTGSYDKQLITWQVNKSEPETIVEGERVTDLAVSKDGRRLVMMTADKKIQMFALPSMSPLARAAAISEVMLEAVGDKDSITSLSLSSDARYLLLNVSSTTRPEIQLWDLEDKIRVQKYRGHKHGRYVIRSALGGYRDALVVSGSEDSQVFVWHRESGRVIGRLAGHSSTINSVTWNPADASMFASASDDTTIRVWGP